MNILDLLAVEDYTWIVPCQALASYFSLGELMGHQDCDLQCVTCATVLYVGGMGALYEKYYDQPRSFLLYEIINYFRPDWNIRQEGSSIVIGKDN